MAACTPLLSINRSTAPRSSMGPMPMLALPEIRNICGASVTCAAAPLASKKVPVSGSRPRTFCDTLVVLTCSRKLPLTLNTPPPSMMVELGLLPPTSSAPYKPVWLPLEDASITRPKVPATPKGSSTGRSSTAVTPNSRVTLVSTWATMTLKSPFRSSAPSNRSRLPLPVSAAYMPVQPASLPGG